MTPEVEEWVECIGPGWANIVRPVVERAVAKGVPIAQVKEKFGGLRIYLDVRDKELEEMISEAEFEADVTCEICGTKENVSTRGKYWVKTLCEQHHKEREERYRG